MATRAKTLSPHHIQALNAIDLEFHGEKFRKVTDSWKFYLDHLNHYPKEDEAQQPIWIERRVDLLTSLLRGHVLRGLKGSSLPFRPLG